LDAGQIVAITLKFIGAISLLLFGMKTMSEGIQNAAGRSLDKFFNYATRNRFLALFTGTLITVIIQSSSATTVMTVSFVNAGIMSFQQSIGIIFGANIGTTLTAWVVAIFGFKIKISAFALPLFGIGFLLTVMKKFRKENIGKALMGFGLLFLGFEFLKDAVPNASEEVRMYLSQFQGVENSAKTLIVGILSGAIITLLLNSSSVVIALIIVMASDGVLPWEFSAALVMGSNIGTTQDVFLASLGTKADAKRTAWVHILFSVFGSIIIACMFVPFLNFVEFMIPDNGNNAAILPLRIAMFHTTFNVFSSAVFIGFTPQITRFMCWFIKAKPGDIKEKYEFVFPEQAIMETNADALMFHFPYIENEISKMMNRTHDMYKVLASSLEDRDNIETYCENLKNEEEYIDQMNKQIRRYMERCFDFMSNPSDRRKLFLMRGIVSKVEHISDKCYWMCHYINEKASEKVYFVDSENKDLKKFYGDNDEFFGTICNIMKSRASSVTNRNVFAELKSRAKEFESFSENRRQEARNNAMVRIMQDDSKENIMNIQEAEDMYIDLMSRIEEISNDIYKISKYISRL
jgi:phosphate:Na+ symporter